MDDRLQQLRQAVELTPDNHMLRLILAETLADSGMHPESSSNYAILNSSGQLPNESLLAAADTARMAGDLILTATLITRAREAGIVEGIADVQQRLDADLGLDGTLRLRKPGEHKTQGEETLQSLDFDPAPVTTFGDVGGLDDVKKAIHRLIILPQQRPDLYAHYGRKSGGGVLLYGPPGCGKTLIARATAGECRLPFSNIRIEEILDPYFGVSEQNLHARFAQARESAPCALFLDEIDAIGYARHRFRGSAGRPLVDQLLQELDSIGSENDNILVLAATNAPWDVDNALQRPGRFDRTLFVPPPDEAARLHILGLQTHHTPHTKLDLEKIANKTSLFSGADLVALTQAAIDGLIDETLETKSDLALTTRHLEHALRDIRPTTLEWLRSARSHIEFANQTGRYDDIATYLNTREAKTTLR